MELTPSYFKSLQPPDTRTTRKQFPQNPGLYLERSQKSYSFQHGYTSPASFKRRYITLAKYAYGYKMTVTDIRNVLKAFSNSVALVLAGKDPLDIKQTARAEHQREANSKTVSDLYQHWSRLDHFKRLAHNTQINYDACYRTHIAPALGNKQSGKVSNADIKAFLKSLPENAVNPALYILRPVFNLAVEQGLIASSPMIGIQAKRKGEAYREPFTSTQIKTLWKPDIINPSKRNLCRFQFLVGARFNEIAQLKWSEIDYLENLITISYRRIKSQRQYKNQKRNLVFPLVPMLQEILAEQSQDSELVFPQRSGKVYLACSINKWLKRTTGRADASTHLLRHTCATWLSELQPINSYDISLILNHQISGMTGKYIHGQQIERKKQVLAYLHKDVCNRLELDHCEKY